MRSLLLTALLLTAPASYAGTCISATGNTRDAEKLAHVYCDNDPGFASAYQVKMAPDYITLRVSLLPAPLSAVRAEAGAIKAATLLGGSLLRLSGTVYVVFVPVRLGDPPPFRTVILRAGQTPVVE